MSRYLLLKAPREREEYYDTRGEAETRAADLRRELYAVTVGRAPCGDYVVRITRGRRQSLALLG